MKSRSRQGRVESGNHKRNIRRSTDLAKYQGFGWEPGAYTYHCLGYKIGLRFSQETGLWTCKCAELCAETEILHQHPQDIENALQNWIAELTEHLTDNWLLDGLPYTRSPHITPIGDDPMGGEIDIDSFQARPRAAAVQQTSAAAELIERHGISRKLAGEMLIERGE